MGFVLSVIVLLSIVYYTSYFLTQFLEKNKALWVFVFGFGVWFLLIKSFYGFITGRFNSELVVFFDMAFLILLPFPYIAGVIALIILVIKKVIGRIKKSSS